MQSVIKKNNSIDVTKVRNDFPILSQKVNGKPLVYFDNGATTQKPQLVIDAIVNHYKTINSNIHRGVHSLSQQSTIAFENARAVVQKHINAAHAHEIIFTKGTTESINLVAHSLGKLLIKKGDEIIITHMEHHSNILPWQVLCEEKGAVLKVVPINEAGELKLETFEKLLSVKTKIIAIAHVSNTLGTINPIKEIIRFVREFFPPLGGEAGRGAAIVVDGAQAIPHMKVDVQELDADFYCFSGHKIYAPSGIGVLYGKEVWLNKLSPYQTGGGTIKKVTFDKTEYAESPLKFEAGTPPIEAAIGLAAAFNYINNIGVDAIAAYEYELLDYALEKIKKIEGVKIVGAAKQKAAVLSFVVEGIHPLDIGTILDKQGIAVRTGHHCTQPLMDFYKIPGTVRASFSFYNVREEVDIFIAGLEKAIRMLK